MNRDCKSYQVGQNCKVSWLNGSLVVVPKGKTFNFDYVLFIPENIENDTVLLIEGSNTNGSTDDMKEANEVMLEEALNPNLPIFGVANELGLPVLYPLFPRVYNGRETIYNHMLSSNSLKSDTFKLTELGLKRVDLQLIEMFQDAKKRLESYGVSIMDKFIIDGFSASSKFANRFTILHPEYVCLCIGGGVSGTLTLPIKKVDNEELLWPVGIGNIEKLCGEKIDDKKIEEFLKVRQFYYMGEDDLNHDPYVLNHQNVTNNRGIITTEELIQMYQIFGQHQIFERWKKSKKIYEEMGVNARFITYQGVGHDPRPATSDIKAEISELIFTLKKENKNRL